MKRVKRSYNSTVEDQQHRNIPSEIVAEILARLPLKSIVTLRCVCKSWHSLLNEPFFARKQLAFSHYVATKCPNHLIIFHYKNKFYAVPAEEEYQAPATTLKPKKLNFPCMEATKSSLSSSEGSCNGLLCFSGLEKILLWNPLIGRVKEIPKSQSQLQKLRRKRKKQLLGLGFVPQTCDYKLVSIEDKVHVGFPQFETCSLRNPTWTTRASIVDTYSDSYYEIISHVSQHRVCFPCVKSNLYFIARKRKILINGRAGIIVLGFDMLEEKFREIPLPNDAISHGMDRHFVCEYQDTIVLLEKRFDVWKMWVMKEDDNNNNVGCKWKILQSLHPYISSRLYNICGEVFKLPTSSNGEFLVIKDSESRKRTLLPFVDGMVEYKEISLALLDDEDFRN